MKQYMYSLLLAVLLQNVSYSNICQNDTFTFELNNHIESELLSEMMTSSDDENLYDAMCDRVPSLKMVWWKRMMTQVYIFWYSKSQYLGGYVVRYGKNISRYAKQWFLLVRNRIKEIKKKYG